jgi:hypothetical protein
MDVVGPPPQEPRPSDLCGRTIREVAGCMATAPATGGYLDTEPRQSVGPYHFDLFVGSSQNASSHTFTILTYFCALAEMRDPMGLGH